MEIYAYITDILNKYIDQYCKVYVSDQEEKDNNEDKFEESLRDIDTSKMGPLEKIIEHLDALNMETDERYVHCFLKVKTIVSEMKGKR